VTRPDYLKRMAEILGDIDPEDPMFTAVLDCIIKLRKLMKVEAETVSANQLPLVLPQ